ncbi:hypothetical protein HX910_003114 [Salmonella enterica]|nr:hypothetical protein [Salmonella enterica]EFP4636043.1 hypothetical protein [Salmonella enterica]EFS0364503.1 hypothetical protein [Salmonella enterica]EGK1506813.1 hypothetical protein [Salmonella enterica]
MAIYMQVRCEGRGGDNKGCHSDVNSDAQLLAFETVKGVSDALAYLKKESLKAGGVLHKGELYCPVCAKAKAWGAAGTGKGKWLCGED